MSDPQKLTLEVSFLSEPESPLIVSTNIYKDFNCSFPLTTGDNKSA